MALGDRFDSRAIFDGLKTKEKLRETPDTFGTRNKVAQQSGNKYLDQNSNRMAMDRARAELLKNDPDEDSKTIEWMKAFSYSPEAEGWNEAKTNGMNPYLNSGEGGDPGPESEAELEDSSDDTTDSTEMTA